MFSGSARRSEFGPDSLDLNGLETLLDRAHVEEAAKEDRDLADSSDFGLITQLLDQLKMVYEILRETNDGLIRANARIVNLASIEQEQSKQLELLQVRTQQVEELEIRLLETLAENETLKHPWWHKAIHSCVKLFS